MGIMDLIRKMSGDRSEVKIKLKEAQQNARVEKMVLDRSKSSNERLLERYMEEERQRNIKAELDQIHKKQNSENWKGNSILKQDMNILKNDKPILMEKNIFLDNKSSNPVTKVQTGMFFKW